VIPSLAVLLEELAASEAGITAAPVDGTTTWSRASRAFAAASGRGFEACLGREIAAAAMRTPDAGPSARGPEWVRFNPRELDVHAVDRVTAWFELAYRRAGE
jgi:hypothetical protein